MPFHLPLSRPTSSTSQSAFLQWIQYDLALREVQPGMKTKTLLPRARVHPNCGEMFNFQNACLRSTMERQCCCVFTRKFNSGCSSRCVESGTVEYGLGNAKRLQATHYFEALSEDALMVAMWYPMHNHSRPHTWSVVRSTLVRFLQCRQFIIEISVPAVGNVAM